MSVEITDDLVEATGLTEAELRLEIAVALFASERLTLAQASRLAAMPQADFLRELGSREVPIHYGVPELEQDLETMRDLSRS